MKFEVLTPYQQKKLFEALEPILDALGEVYPIIIETISQIIEPFINAFLEIGKQLAIMFDEFDWRELQILFWWNQYQYLRGIKNEWIYKLD